MHTPLQVPIIPVSITIQQVVGSLTRSNLMVVHVAGTVVARREQTLRMHLVLETQFWRTFSSKCVQPQKMQPETRSSANNLHRTTRQQYSEKLRKTEFTLVLP